MSILINKNTKVITQGITGKTGQFHTEKCQEYANGKNCFVAGVNPKKLASPFLTFLFMERLKRLHSKLVQLLLLSMFRLLAQLLRFGKRLRLTSTSLFVLPKAFQYVTCLKCVTRCTQKSCWRQEYFVTRP